MPSHQEPQNTGRVVRAAMFVAAATIAHLVAGKAIQVALFLSTSTTNLALARMTLGSGLFSIIFFFLVYRVMTRQGPARLVPAIYGASALLLLGEWALLLQNRRLGAILLFLHLNAFSLVLISGFWSLVSERFDPRTAKRQIGRIGGAATFGGLLGGLTSLGFSAQATLGGVSVASMVPLLALVHGLCAWQVRQLASVPGETGAHPAAAARHPATTELGSGLRRLLGTAYLRDLALLVLLVAVAEGLIDYVFKTRAKVFFRGDESGLAFFFGFFYTAVAFFAFVTQRVLSRPALERVGLVWTVASLPLVMALGGLSALLLPGLPTVGGARAVGAIVRDSLYRSGYELLYVPVSTGDKRATKLILDVGVVRLGDVVWGSLVPLISAVMGVRGLFGLDLVFPGILAVAVLVAGVAFLLVSRFHRGYVHALEKSLVARGGHLGSSGSDGLTTHTTLLQTFGGLDLTGGPDSGSTPAAERPSPPAGSGRAEFRPPGTAPDPILDRIVDLRSNDLDRVRNALRSAELDLALVSPAISLLAWDDVAVDAIEALRGVAPRVTGQLVDGLLDPEAEFAVRRRLPRVLTAGEPVRAVEGLFAALADSRFEVRYRVGRALARLQERHPVLSYPRERVLTAVLGEVAVDRRLWEHRRLLDHLAGDDESPFVDQYLRDRANRGLEHVFTVLSLILPREPLTIAFRGLHTEDAHLRGTALEYLETALPEEVRLKLWPFLEDDRKNRVSDRSREEILESLLQSNDTIADRIRKGRRAKD